MLHELRLAMFECGSSFARILPKHAIFEGTQRRERSGVQRVDCDGLRPIGVPDMERAKIDILRLSAPI